MPRRRAHGPPCASAAGESAPRASIAVLLGLDRPQEAFAPIEAIERVDPHAPSIVLHYRARALFMLDRYDEAIEVLCQRIARSPDTDTSRALLASIYGHLGRRDEAASAWAELQRVNPGYVPDRRRSIASDREYEKLCDGLRKAKVLRRRDASQSGRDSDGDS